jgi:hypothetical protein
VENGEGPTVQHHKRADSHPHQQSKRSFSMTVITPTSKPTTSRIATARLNREVAATTGGTGSQWDYLYNAVVSRYPGLAPANGAFFQFSAAPNAATWVTPEDANAYGTADAVSASLGAFYIPTGSFSSAYASLIRSIRPATGDSNPDYLAIQQKLEDQEDKYTALITAATAAFHVANANNPGPNGTNSESFTKWMSDPFGGASWGDQVMAIRAAIAEDNKELAAILVSIDAALGTAVAALSTDTMNISTGGSAVQVPRTTIGGTLAGDKERWDVYPPGKFDFDSGPMNSETVVTGPWQTVVTTTVSHGSCGSTTVSQNIDTSRIVTDEHFSLRVQAVGFEGYTIKRGQWYDETFVDPKMQIVQGAGVTNDTFFGLNGSLHMIPDQVIVMYRPTISLTVSTQCYKEEIEANATVSTGGFTNLFGFQFQFQGIHGLNPVGDDVTTTVTFPSPDDSVPQILGVISKSAYNGNK